MIKSYLRKILVLLKKLLLDKLKLDLYVMARPDVDSHQLSLKKINNEKDKINYIKSIHDEHPDSPSIQLLLAQTLYSQSNSNCFNEFKRYGEIRESYLNKTGLNYANIDLIWPGMFIGAFGNHYAVEGLIEASELDMTSGRIPSLLLSDKYSLTNRVLFSYFKEKLNIIDDQFLVKRLLPIQTALTLPLGYCLPLKNSCPFLDFAANIIYTEKINKNKNKSIFKLKDIDRKKGENVLREMGIPVDAWYVTAHIRQQEWDGGSNAENWRNADPETYLKSFKYITDNGGYVFRMGDPSMSKLPDMPRVIDYAHHEIKSEFMDIFLAATCKFCLGTSSGYFRVPRYFGVPVILTNSTNTLAYYSLRKNDLYLPRLIKSVKNNQYLSFKEQLEPPHSMHQTEVSRRLADEGLVWEENHEDDLYEATKEMVENVFGFGPGKEQVRPFQDRYKSLAEQASINYSNDILKGYSAPPEKYLIKYSELF